MSDKHTMTCNNCGMPFQMNDLKQVVEHEHIDSFFITTTHKSKKVISNARNIYPYCGGEFAGGVHTYMQGMPCPTRPCDDDHIQGWLCADRDKLTERYTLEF
jgi:hypothetical protein